MNETTQKNSDFVGIYNKSYRLAAAVFMISNVIDGDEELKTKIKSLSLNLVSGTVNLKDINLYDIKKSITDIEKNSLELMSMMDIACVSGLISKMNGSILKEEFQSFVLELGKFSEKSENSKNVSVKNVFGESVVPGINGNLGIETGGSDKLDKVYKDENRNGSKETISGQKSNNGHKRKDLRKSMILDFIKGHNNVSIKDIVPNITGCSEKTIQRELLLLISEGKIKKMGERRWSKYSII